MKKVFTRKELEEIEENARYEAAQLAIQGKVKQCLKAVANIDKVMAFVNSEANMKFNKFAVINGSFRGIA